MSARTAGLRADLTPGLVLGIAAVPDAIASAVLAGIGPVHGLVAVMVGMPVAALTTGSVFLVATTTNALALLTRDGLAGIQPEEIPTALALLTVMAGLLQVTLGVLRAGVLTRFISNAVMTGFFTGVAVQIVVSQLPDLLGQSGGAGNSVTKLLHVGQQLDRAHLPTIAVSAATIGMVLAVERTRFAAVAMLVALAAAWTLAVTLGWRDVALLRETTRIPLAVPAFVMPALSQLPGLAFSAIAVACVGLIQGAGISQSVANPDGHLPDPSRDFSGQGLANVTSGFLGGMPIGGSVSATSLALQAGARSRATKLVCALCVAAAVLFFGRLLEQLPTAAIAALLVMAGVRSVNRATIAAVWQTSPTARTAMLVTCAATLILPIANAVLLGIAASFALELYASATQTRLVELVPGSDGGLRERAAPPALASHQSIVLMPYGTLSFAGARALEAVLPDSRSAAHAVVVLVLRGRQEVGSTFLRILVRYTDDLRRHDGRLMLAGVGTRLQAQLQRTGALEAIGAANVFAEHRELGEAVREAVTAARQWLGESAVDAMPRPGCE